MSRWYGLGLLAFATACSPLRGQPWIGDWERETTGALDTDADGEPTLFCALQSQQLRLKDNGDFSLETDVTGIVETEECADEDVALVTLTESGTYSAMLLDDDRTVYLHFETMLRVQVGEKNADNFEQATAEQNLRLVGFAREGASGVLFLGGLGVFVEAGGA